MRLRASHRFCLIAGLASVVFASSCRSSPTRRARQRTFESRQSRIKVGAERGWRRRNKPRVSTPKIERYRELGESLGAVPVAIDAPCLDRRCRRRSLGRLFNKFDRIEEDRQGVARILILGDSHIAADYIARTVRERLQNRFGNAGRGFVAIDQKAQYGGRRLTKTNWVRTRIVDGNGPGKAFGFAGMRLDALRQGASIEFELGPYDDDVVAYYLGRPNGSTMSFYADGEKIGRVKTRADNNISRIHRIAVPEATRGKDAPPTRLRIVANGPASIFGLSFESYEAGIILDAIGPVGADARVYLQMDERSLEEHLHALDPDLVMLMVGGNDALAIRKGQRSLREVEDDHVKLLERIKTILPDADCLVWGPLDAGVRKKGRIRSKTDLIKIRDLQRQVAYDMKCSFWDTYSAMGGTGSFERWFERGLMNRDLIHPRAKGGNLIGHLFTTALLDAYLNGS